MTTTTLGTPGLLPAPLLELPKAEAECRFAVPGERDAPPAPEPRCSAARATSLYQSLIPADQRLLVEGYRPGAGPKTPQGVELRLVSALLSRGATETEVSWFLTNPVWASSVQTRAFGLEHLGRTIALARNDPRGNAEVLVKAILGDTRTLAQGGVRLLLAPVSRQSEEVVSFTACSNFPTLHRALLFDPAPHSDDWKHSTTFSTPIRARVQFRKREYPRGRGPDGRGGFRQDLPQWSVNWWPHVPPEAPGAPGCSPIPWLAEVDATRVKMERRGLLIDLGILDGCWRGFEEKKRREAAQHPVSRAEEILQGLAGTATFMKKYRAAVEPDGRLRYRLGERAAGRLYAFAPSTQAPERASIQSLPGSLRPAIRADPGMHLIYVDYSGAHFRNAAALANDERAQGDLRRGVDPYEPLAAQLRHHLPEAGLGDRAVRARKLAKRLILMWLNHPGNELLRKVAADAGIRLDPGELRQFLEATWPQIASWRLNPTLTSSGGTRRALDGFFLSPLGRGIGFPRRDQWTDLGSTPRSGCATSAILTALEADAMWLTLGHLNAPGWQQVQPLLPMHDGLLVQAPAGTAGQWAQQLAALMEGTWTQVCNSVCPKAVAEVPGPTWGTPPGPA